MSTICRTGVSLVHKCDLPEYVDLILPTPSPYAPIQQKICYYIRKTFTIYESHSTQQYFRSHASFRQEKARHLTTPKYRYVIHPLSKFTKYEHALMSLVWLFLLIYQPMNGSFFAEIFIKSRIDPYRIPFNVSSFIYSSIIFFDIIIRFFLGYTINKTREIVLEHDRIVKHYLKTFFVVDIIPLVTMVLLSTLLKDMPYKYKLLMFQLTSIRMLRLKTVMEGFENILKKFNLKRACRVALIIYVASLIMVHWWCCLFRLLNVIRTEFGISIEDSWYIQLQVERERQRAIAGSYAQGDYIYENLLDYLQYMTVMLCHFLGAGVGNHATNDALEMFVLAWFLICSLMIYLTSLATLLQYFGVANASEFKFEEIIGQVQEYMIMKRFPLSLRKRIIRYYDYKYNKKFFSEKKILSTLTEHLQMEILLYSCENMIKKVQLFKGLSRGAVGCILALLQQEIYLPNDEIMTSDDNLGTLYFILFGTCGIQLVTGKESMHIEDGCLFGENREITRNTSQNFVYKVVAIEPCEIYSLAAEDIRYCCRHYPEFKIKIEAMSHTKARVYNVALSKAAEEDVHISASDIVAELRKRRILQQRRHRVDTLHTLVD